jgi:dethiobiotin synthetase
MRPPGLFVAGTDTGVGKTMVSAALLLALRRREHDVGYLKPVATDGFWQDGKLINEDALLVRSLAGLEEDFNQINPVCLPLALSPLAAARREKLELSFLQIVAAVTEAFGRHRFTIVEGAGGLLVPICEGHTILDLMGELVLPVLLVGRPGLGTINHTLLSLNALRARSLHVVGFCFSGTATGSGEDASISENAELIREFSGERFLGTLPWVGEKSDGDYDPGLVAELAGDHLDLTAFTDLIY